MARLAALVSQAMEIMKGEEEGGYNSWHDQFHEDPECRFRPVCLCELAANHNANQSLF